MNKIQLDMFFYVARNVICSISAAFGHLGKNINVLHDVMLRNEEMQIDRMNEIIKMAAPNKLN